MRAGWLVWSWEIVKVVEELVGGAKLVEHRSFADHRGHFAVLFETGAAEAVGLPGAFVQDNYSFSRFRGTVRGLHLQLPPWEQGKLVRVGRGAVLDVIVDLRPGSPTRGHWADVRLEGGDDLLLWVPAGFAHGFCTLEADTEIHYKVDAPYRPEAELALAWDDPALGIEWPVDAGEALLSDKDAIGLDLQSVLEAIGSATARPRS